MRVVPCVACSSCSRFWCFFVASLSKAQAHDDCSISLIKEISPHEIRLDQVIHGRQQSSFPLDEVCPRPFAPGEITTEFAGIEGIIIRRMQSYYNRYTNRYLQEYYNQSSMNPCEFDRYVERIWGRRVGQYYQRSFFQSMLSEKGGAGPSLVEKVGSTHEFINILGISLFTDGKIKTGGLRFFLDSTRVPSPFSQDPNSLLDNSLVRRARVVGGLQFEERARFDRFEFTFRPNITFRLDQPLNSMLSSVSATTKLKIYSQHRKHTPIVVVTSTVRYEPSRDYLVATCVVELLIW